MGWESKMRDPEKPIPDPVPWVNKASDLVSTTLLVAIVSVT
jgi:hypothetical protein